MEQIGGDMNELLNTKMCSPMMIYLAILVTSGLSVYITRSHLKRHNTNKMDNLFNLYSLNELKFMIVFGIILFGLCQYNKTTLAWIFLLFPVVYLIIQNLIVHIHVTTAIQTSPKEIDLSVLQQQQHQVQASAAQVVPQDTQQTPPPQQMVPTMNQTEMPSSTSVSQPFGNGGPSNYAYF